MPPISRCLALLFLAAMSISLPAQQSDKDGKKSDAKPAEAPAPSPDSTTENTVTVSGEKVAYRAVAGTLTVGATDAYDTMLGLDGRLLPDAAINPPDAAKPEDAPATARIFYVAYFKKDVPPGSRPIMFLYNGGPGSSTMWLHMGSFGPRRIVTPDTEHKPAAPYTMVDNQYSLLDVSDLVFIDAPGTGFSRIMGKDKEKAFWESIRTPTPSSVSSAAS